MSKQELTTEHVLMYEAQKRSTIVAYLLWFFLGVWGVHCFYIRNVERGVFYIVLWPLSIFLFLWEDSFASFFQYSMGGLLTVLLLTVLLLIVLLIIDAFTLHKKVDDCNMDLLRQLKEGSMQQTSRKESKNDVARKESKNDAAWRPDSMKPLQRKTERN